MPQPAPKLSPSQIPAAPASSEPVPVLSGEAREQLGHTLSDSLKAIEAGTAQGQSLRDFLAARDRRLGRRA